MIKSLEKYIDVKIANILLHISIDMGPPNIVEHDNVGLFLLPHALDHLLRLGADLESKDLAGINAVEKTCSSWNLVVVESYAAPEISVGATNTLVTAGWLPSISVHELSVGAANTLVAAGWLSSISAGGTRELADGTKSTLDSNEGCGTPGMVFKNMKHIIIF